MANLLQLLLLLLLLIETSATEDQLDTNTRQADTLPIETRQLKRKRITLDLCTNNDDLRTVGDNGSPRGDKPIASGGPPPNSHEPKLECADTERIALVSLEDLTYSHFPLMPGTYQRPDTVAHMVNDICNSKGLRFADNTRQVTKESGNNWHIIPFIEHCRELLNDHRSGFANLRERCNNLSQCSPSSTDWFPVDIEKNRCTKLARARLSASVRLEYVCEPRELIYETRRVAYRDLRNTISCYPDSLLYVKRASLSTQEAAVQATEASQPCHDKCNPNVQLDATRVGPNLSRNDDYETEVELDISQTTDSPSSPSVPSLFNDSLSQHGIQSKRPVGQFAISRTKREATNNATDCPAAEVILALCHARVACLVILSKVLQGLRKKYRCQTLDESELAHSFAEIDYFCVERSKFEPTDQLSIARVTHKTSTTSKLEPFKREVLNQQDRRPVYISELGNVPFEEPESGNQSDGARAAQRSGVPRLDANLVYLVATAWIIYKLTVQTIQSRL